MIRDTGGYGGRTTSPTTAIARQVDRDTQAGMVSTEVVYRAEQIHRRVQRFGLPRQRPAAAHQEREPGAEGGVEPLNVGDVDLPSALRLLPQTEIRS